MSLKEIFENKDIKWKVVKMGEILETLSSGTGKRVVNDTGIMSLGGENITSDGNIMFTYSKFLELKEKQSLNVELKKGDVLVVKDGATTGKVGYFNGNYFYDGKITINEHLFLLRFVESIFSKYVYFFLKSGFGYKQMTDLMTQGAIGGLTKGAIYEIRIPIPYKNSKPDLEAQKIIVDFLDKVIGKLDNMYFLSQILYHTENKSNSPSAKFKKMLEYIADKQVSLEEGVKFIGGNEMVKNYIEYVETYFGKKEDEEETKWKEYLNQDNYWDKIYEEELGRVFGVLRSEEGSEEVRREKKRGFRVEIPEVEIGEDIEWRGGKMPDIGLIQKGIKPSSGNEKVYIDLDFLRKGNVKYVGEGMDVEKDELILVWDGSNAGDVFVSPIDGILSSTFAKISIRKQGIYNKYVYYYLIYLKKELLGERTGTGIPHINGKKLSKKIIPIPYNKKIGQPDLETQQKIVAYLDKFTEFINYQKVQTKNLQENILKAKEQILKSVFGRMM